MVLAPGLFLTSKLRAFPGVSQEESPGSAGVPGDSALDPCGLPIHHVLPDQPLTRVQGTPTQEPPARLGKHGPKWAAVGGLAVGGES